MDQSPCLSTPEMACKLFFACFKWQRVHVFGSYSDVMQMAGESSFPPIGVQTTPAAHRQISASNEQGPENEGTYPPSHGCIDRNLHASLHSVMHIMSLLGTEDTYKNPAICFLALSRTSLVTSFAVQKLQPICRKPKILPQSNIAGKKSMKLPQR